MRHIGITTLKDTLCTARNLKQLDEVLIIDVRSEPAAALIPYHIWQEINENHLAMLQVRRDRECCVPHATSP